MSTEICKRIKGNTKIAEYVNIHNENVEKLENVIDELKSRIEILENSYNKKVDKTKVTDIVSTELTRVMDTEYNLENSGRRFVRREELKDIIMEILNPDGYVS